MRRASALDVVTSGTASGIHRLRISSGVSVLLLFMLSGAGASHAADSRNAAFDQTFAYCRDIDGYLVTPPEWKQPQAPQEISASNSFSPLPDALLRQLKVKGNVITPEPAEKMALTVSMLKPPSHGKMKDLAPPDQRDHSHLPERKTLSFPTGTTSYHYTFMPDLGYQGQDQVVYEVRADGNRYRVVVNFLVVPAVRDKSPSQCASEKFDG